MAYGRICSFILKKRPPSDPYNSDWRHDYGLEYEEILDICEILELMETDSSIYYIIEKISETVVLVHSHQRW